MSCNLVPDIGGSRHREVCDIHVSPVEMDESVDELVVVAVDEFVDELVVVAVDADLAVAGSGLSPKPW